MTIGVGSIEELSNIITGAPFEINGDGYGSGITSPSAGTLMRTNLCTNPSFEANTTGWSAVNGTETLSRITTAVPAAPFGIASLAVVDVSAVNTAAGAKYTVAGLVIGQTYTVTAYALHAGTAVQFSVLGDTPVTPNGAWTMASSTFVATGTTKVIDLSFIRTSAGVFAGGIDGVLIEKGTGLVGGGAGFGAGVFGDVPFGGGTLTTYFDGDTEDGSGNRAYFWTGTANASTSVARATFTEIVDIDTASEFEQIILTRDSNPGVYGFEDPEGTIQIFDSATARTGAATLSVGPDNYSAIDMTFDTDHIVNVVLIKYFEKVKVGKKGTRKVEHDHTYTHPTSIAKYGRFKKVHQVHKKINFAAYANQVFARNALPATVPRSITIPMNSPADLLGGYEDGHYVTKKINVEAPDGTVYGCRIGRIQHQITPTAWAVQIFLRNPHVIQHPRQSELATEVAHTPDGLVLNAHLEDGAVDGGKLADEIDATGKTLSNGTVQTNDDDTANRIAVRDDGSGGVVEFWPGVSGQTKGVINPAFSSGGGHRIAFQTSKSGSPYGTPGAMALVGSATGQDPQLQLGVGTHLLVADGDAGISGQLNVGGAIHSQNGGLWMDDLGIGGSTTDASIGASGRVIRTPSSRRYKDEVTPLTYDQARGALDLEPVTFKLKSESDNPDRRTYPGFIAEQAADAGAELWVNRDAEGNPHGFRYAELTAAHNLLIQRLFERDAEKDQIIADLTSRLEALEG